MRGAYKTYVNNCLEQGAHEALIKWFKKFKSLDDLSEKVVLWGHVFMPDYLKEKTPPFHYGVVKKFFNNKNEYNAYPRGFGKAYWSETPTFTTEGFKKLKDIKVGDFVFSEKGKPVKVLYKSEVYEDRDCYKVKFSDGSEIVADATHDWLVEDNLLRHRIDYKPDRSLKRRKSLKMKKMTTEELSKDLFVDRKDGRKESKYSIPTTEPLKFGKKDLLVDPYFLGQWLGDGTSASCAITTEDEETVEFIYAYAEELGLKVRVQETGNNSKTYNITSGKGKDRVKSLMSRLNKIGVLNNKHIPDVYKHSDQRIEVLRGLMDSDGYINKKGYCEFTTTKARLAVDALELIKSFGIKATAGCYDAIKNGRVVGKKYRICFTTDIDVFSLNRKKARKTEKKDPRIKRRFITEIEKIKSVPVQCLQVDNPAHLFLAGKSLIPTHNTTMIQVCMAFSIAHGLDKFIVLLEKSHEEASEVLDGVREAFRYSDRIRKVYGELSGITMSGKAGATKDSVGDFYLNGVRLKGRGFDKNVRGLKSRETRPTRIILDDVESDEHIENPEQRRKYLNNYLRGVIPATDPAVGNVKMFGTILHDDSLLQTLVNEHKGEVLRAWDADRKLLWPKMWTPERLEEKRKQMGIEGRGDAAFYQEYFNEPVSEDDQVFKEDMFRYFNDVQMDEILKKPHECYVTVDPAISQRETADYTAIAVTVVNRQGNVYVAEIVRKRLTPLETYKTIFHLYEKWAPKKVGIESTAYQKSLIYYINEQKRNNDLVRRMQVQEIKSDMDKVRKIKMLEPRYNLGSVYHRENDPMTKILESELLRFPRAATDDVVDALSSIEQMISVRRRPVRSAYKKFRRTRQVAY